MFGLVFPSVRILSLYKREKLFVVGIGLLDNVSLKQRTNLEERIQLPPEGQL